MRPHPPSLTVSLREAAESLQAHKRRASQGAASASPHRQQGALSPGTVSLREGLGAVWAGFQEEVTHLGLKCDKGEASQERGGGSQQPG